jgi:hypothetical protein
LVLGELGWVHNFYFVAVALLGTTLAPNTSRPVKTIGRDVAAIIAVFLVYIAAKFEMDHGHGTRFFLLLHVLAVVLCLLALRVSAADELHALLGRIKPLAAAVALLAGLTLEIYVVQQNVFSRLELLSWPRPIGFLAFWVFTLSGAFVLQKLAAWVMRLFQPKAPSPQPVTSPR